MKNRSHKICYQVMNAQSYCRIILLCPEIGKELWKRSALCSRSCDEHTCDEQHPVLSNTFSRHRLFFLLIMFNFTCDEQHLSNAANNSHLGSQMASLPLASNTFQGGACVASANKRPITNVYEPGFCKRVAQSWHSSLWLLQMSSCLMGRSLGLVWACVRTACAFQVQTSRACRLKSSRCR